MRRTACTLLLAALPCACASGAAPSDAPPNDPPPIPPPTTTSADRLTRIAAALTGVRPTIEEQRAARSDPKAIEDAVDRWLDSKEFGATMRELHNEALLVRTDFYAFPAGFNPRGPLANETAATINNSLFEAPLALIEYVIMNERPYTEIVTADYTLANHVVAQVWNGIPYTAGGDEWQLTRHIDERDNAGVLSDSWLFSRHTTTVSNANRGRANAVAKAFLCYDFLDRNVAVDTNVDFADPQAVARAVQDNAACASCHHSLDPLAAFFRDYVPIYVPAMSNYPVDHYYPGILSSLGGTVSTPAYFGKSGSSLRELGQLIAADPRFSLCAAKRFYAFFHQERLADVPSDRASALQKIFVESGYDAKKLARAIILADDFEHEHLLKLGPEQASRMIEELTGFRWTASVLDLGNVDLSTDSFLGYKVLAGGIDGYNVTLPSYTFNATSHLFFAELAARAAAYVVEMDFKESDPAKRKLLHLVEGTEQREEQIRAQLKALDEYLFGGDGSDDEYALFRGTLDETGDVKLAWKAVLTAMLQDFRIATY